MNTACIRDNSSYSFPQTIHDFVVVNVNVNWNMKKTITTALLLVALAPGLTGCATIMDGTKQTVGFSSNPSNATVTIDGKVLGQTPLTEELSKKKTHLVKINLDGYYPYEMNLTKKTNGWVWGNIIFGGFIGLAVDAATGGMYKLTPEQVHAEMKKNGVASINHADKNILVTVTLTPDPSWQKLDKLQSL
jgi:hypothetical protein